MKTKVRRQNYLCGRKASSCYQLHKIPLMMTVRKIHFILSTWKHFDVVLLRFTPSGIPKIQLCFDPKFCEQLTQIHRVAWLQIREFI